MDLTLPLKSQYFDQVRAGTKVEEYRLRNAYWARRIENRSYDWLVLTRGYPRRDDHENRIVLPWRGYQVKAITHPHFSPFGLAPVWVYAIQLGEPA
jgi:hypothetical protein